LTKLDQNALLEYGWSNLTKVNVMGAPVSLYTAKTQLSRLVDRAAAGEEIIISKSGRPMARLVAYPHRTKPRVLGGYEGKIKIHKGFASLPADVARAFAGETE